MQRHKHWRCLASSPELSQGLLSQVPTAPIPASLAVWGAVRAVEGFWKLTWNLLCMISEYHFHIRNSI